MQNLIKRFLSFDNLLGVGLARIVYYFGLVIICGLVVVIMLASILSFFGGNISGGVMQVIAAPAIGLVALVFWRFACEVFVVLFEMNQHLSDLRNAVYSTPPTPPDPNAPHF